ncbi:MAG: 4Fe-4S dicluster domain-containing protein [Sphingobacteriales bacterium]|uniref:(Fe-S)-binding protein n=1 Tax=Hydrotalea flava TaxID=714549 RepID=UPI0008346A26|nr:(Fe-S)-binding protein [Hydrotalea flava]RTL48647.1 MAG: 4Fe-4S dicluster domain-containing protein [Sphingobacteriales bacterium]
MHIIPQLVFILILAAGIYLFSAKARYIRKNILMGRDEVLNDRPELRWRNVLLLAFGQKKMFKNPLVAVMHFIIYAGFIIINIEVLEIILDGILGTHRLFAAPLGPMYALLINLFECLAVGVIVVCVIFLVRRNILHIRRFMSKDLNGWPRSDANYILITEIILMSLFLTMNATDTLLQSRGYGHYAEHITGNFLFSEKLHSPFNGLSSGQLAFIERSAWWLHIVGIIAFLNYLPYSKHLHILLAFPNAYYASLEPKGKMHNMPDIQKEVRYAMQPELIPANAPQATAHKFGARDVMDLSWKNLLDAYACTECGRCTAACPANITGKLLSPRMIMMKTRDRLEEVGQKRKAMQNWQDDGKSLLHDYITEEELRACTTCNACVEECPVSISPLDIILQMRRYLIMEESNAPQEWNSTFSNIENNFAPWKFSPEERDQWAKD